MIYWDYRWNPSTREIHFMNKKTFTVSCLLLGSVLAMGSGCASNTSRVVVIADQPSFALGAFGGDMEDSKHTPLVLRLGAGDSLGQSMYTVYLAHYRAEHQEQRMAGVRTDDYRE